MPGNGPRVLGERASRERLLEVRELHVSYGAIKALRGVSLRVGKGEVVALIGATGAGKTSTLRAVSGMLRPTAGAIRLEGKDICGLKSNLLVPKGMAHAPEGRGIFLNLTLEENLELGAYLRRDKAEVKKDLEYCLDLFPVLRERRSQVAGTLSGGEQQMLAISRALMSRPTLMLLDEPAAGMNTREKADLMLLIRDLRERFELGILVIEHDMKLVMGICEDITVLDHGDTISRGTPEAVRSDRRVIEAYLGENYLKAHPEAGREGTP